MNKSDQELKFTSEAKEASTNRVGEGVFPEDTSNVPQRKGVILKDNRLERGLTLESVHEATKIPMDALKAIEEGYTVRTLSPFYIKGFVKIYANFLNIDVTEVVDDYQKEELPKVTKKEVDTDFEFKIKQTLKKYLTHQRKKQLLALLGIFVVLFLLFKAIVFLMQSFTNRPKKQTVKVVKKVKPAPSATVTQPPVKPKDKKVIPKPVQPKVVAPKPKLVPKPKPKPVVVPQVQAAPVVVVPAVEQVQKEITLTIRALKDSWLRVKADERTVFQSTLNEGAIETWRADKNIVITGKNIIHLEFELNGKMIGTLGRKNRRAKSVTITKDGLSVTK